MKIVQNPESGEVGIQLDQDEKYDIEEHLNALIDFVSIQAIKIHDLNNSCKKIVERLDLHERKLSEVNQ
jgi:hypothetical protein